MYLRWIALLVVLLALVALGIAPALVSAQGGVAVFTGRITIDDAPAPAGTVVQLTLQSSGERLGLSHTGSGGLAPNQYRIDVQASAVGGPGAIVELSLIDGATGDVRPTAEKPTAMYRANFVITTNLSFTLSAPATPTATAAPTPTATPVPTAAPVPTPTTAPTATAVPTATPAPTATRIPTSTAFPTAVPPTATTAPEPTAIPPTRAPTATPVPPTVTPTPTPTSHTAYGSADVHIPTRGNPYSHAGPIRRWWVHRPPQFGRGPLGRRLDHHRCGCTRPSPLRLEKSPQVAPVATRALRRAPSLSLPL